MNKKVLGVALTTLGVAVAVANTTQAAELEFEKPDFTMFASLGVLDRKDADFDPEAFELELGLKGLVKFDEFKMAYSLIADVADATNSRDTGGVDGEADIHIRHAAVVFPTKYGAFVLAPRGISGQHRDLYSNINIFEYNEAHSGSVTPTGMAGIFGQPDEGQDVVAYVTPSFYNIKATMAVLSIDEENSNDVDARSFRLVYDDKKLNLGAGIVLADKVLAGANDDYKRMAFTVGYSFERLDIGATYEINKDTFGPRGDYDSFGVTGRYHFGNSYSAAVGYYEKDSDVDAYDNDGTVFQVKKEFNKNIAAWAETGLYDNTADNIAVGVNIRF